MHPFPRIRIHHPRVGALIVRDGLSLCFYFEQPHQKIARHVRDSLDAYILAVGSEKLAWSPDANGDIWELDDKAWAGVQHKLRDEGGGIVVLMDRPDAINGFRFEYRGRAEDALRSRDVCALSFWLPTEYMEEYGPGQVRALVLQLGAALPFSSGHAGLAIHRLGRTLELQELCSRYPGMDITEAGHLSWNLGTRINGTHWMNFLGPPVLDELGGVHALRSRLSAPDTTVLALDDARAVVTLGEAPEAGDSEPGPALAPYRELARVLEPWLYHETYIPDGFTPEELLRWERRFL